MLTSTLTGDRLETTFAIISGHSLLSIPIPFQKSRSPSTNNSTLVSTEVVLYVFSTKNNKKKKKKKKKKKSN